jgi:hypothetical protein
MSQFGFLGIGPRGKLQQDQPQAAYLLARLPLKRILAFRARSIDDVVNSPMVKNEILAFWKLHKQLQAMSEILELEQQWNSV